MCSILLLEDHADTSRVLKRLLHHWGHEVATADRVTKALDLANGQTFDVILSDIALPDGDGCNFMREVRQGRCRRTLALAVSAYTTPADRVRAKLAGFHGYFAKPNYLDRLRTFLASVI